MSADPPYPTVGPYTYTTRQPTPDEDDLVTWTMPREEARDLLRWLRHNRPLGMPDRTFDGLMDALTDTRVLPPGSTEASRG